MDDDRLQKIIDAVMKELEQAGLLSLPHTPAPHPAPAGQRGKVEIGSLVPSGKIPSPGYMQAAQELEIDLPYPTLPVQRGLSGVENAADAEGLQALMRTTPARIGIGRAGVRYRTSDWLLFQGDHAITQDALMREVDEQYLANLGLFSVQTRITGGKEEYLLRPDLGRQLDEQARRAIQERCVQKPNVQVCVGDGLSAAAIEANLGKIIPVLYSGFQSVGLSLGTPFFIRYCRVGVMNDIGDLLQPDVLILLIGERPGLGRAESMSAYMAYQPHSGHSDADREVICNIYDQGGTNPLEAGAYVVQLAQKMLLLQASGVKMRLLETEKGGG